MFGGRGNGAVGEGGGLEREGADEFKFRLLGS